MVELPSEWKGGRSRHTKQVHAEAIEKPIASNIRKRNYFCCIIALKNAVNA